ncbi:MAG: pyruvate kinase [Deltaproteobacteria bacterium]|nr:pyruvate kinase [Deltaproteobacteria bacterium]
MNLRQLFTYWTLQVFAPGKLLRLKYLAFKDLLRHDKKSLELITDLEELLHRNATVDWARVESLLRALLWSVESLLRALTALQPTAYQDLEERFRQLESSLPAAVSLPEMDCRPPYTLTLAEAGAAPVLAGGKAHTLGRILRETALPVPPGFVITSRAFSLFLEHNHLRHRLDELLAQVQLDDWERLIGLCKEMRDMVREGEIPLEVQGEIHRRLDDSRRQGLTGPWVLRSSACFEDGEASFAGQYRSLLQVPDPQFLPSYKEVLAGKYTPRAVAYRLRCGLADQETPMAVLVLPIIDAVVSGVVYTREPQSPAGPAPCLAVYAVPGLGASLVDGSKAPEVHYLSRERPPRLLAEIAGPECALRPGVPGGVCLAPATAVSLAGWGLTLEELTGRPQDLEWCQDRQGRLFLLQARPLKPGTADAQDLQEVKDVPEVAPPVLLQGGVTASPGVGTGTVWLLRQEADLGEVPEGAVLVAPTLPPAFAAVIQRLRGVVSDGGSRASHFAAVAREYGLPVLVGAGDATRRLTPGQVVTVDAGHGRIYQGEVESLKQKARQEQARPETPFATRLKALMRFISPLHLLDPASPEFTPRNCRSLNDLVRFAHEKGMAEMFSLVGRQGRGLAKARRLETELPLVMYVLDLDGGLDQQSRKARTIAPQFITSEPMRACWAGLSHPDVVWRQGLLHLDWEELDRISAGLMSLKSARLASYAILAQDYLHLVLRFGYHFAVLDTLCSDNPEANYLAFRFKGGGGNFPQRLRRVQLIQMVLEWAGFTVKTRGDLLDARLARQAAGLLLPRLTLLGILQGQTCLLDISLTGEEQVSQFVRDFQERYAGYVEPQ